jgi:DNA-binding beta-propeller fold protein YncE
VPFGVVITPDATTAAVSNVSNSPNPNLFQLDLANTPITIGSTTGSLPSGHLVFAISPDGARIYAPGRSGEDIAVAKTSDFSLLAPIPQSIFAPYNAFLIALSPNKAEGYVTTSNQKLFVVNTDTNTVKTSFDTSFNTAFTVVTPDGAEVYISYNDSSILSYVTLSDETVHDITGLPSASETGGLAMAPDGTAMYAIQVVGTQFVLTKVDTKTHAFVTQYPVPPQIATSQFISITPDGKTCCLPDSSGQAVAFMDLTTGNSTILDIPEAHRFFS